MFQGHGFVLRLLYISVLRRNHCCATLHANFVVPHSLTIPRLSLLTKPLR
jgi:hypothetical protein